MPTAATASFPASLPDDTSTPRGRLLSLVRKLIDYGKELAGILKQRGAVALGSPARCPRGGPNPPRGAAPPPPAANPRLPVRPPREQTAPWPPQKPIGAVLA